MRSVRGASTKLRRARDCWFRGGAPPASSVLEPNAQNASSARNGAAKPIGNAAVFSLSTIVVDVFPVARWVGWDRGAARAVGMVWVARHEAIGDAFFDKDAAEFLAQTLAQRPAKRPRHAANPGEGPGARPLLPLLSRLSAIRRC